MTDPRLQFLMAQTRIEDMQRAAAAQRRAAAARPTSIDTNPVTIRFGFPDDADAIARLAELDSAEPLPQPTLLAEVGGQLRAALSLLDGSAIADRAYPSAQVMELLHLRARQLLDRGRPRGLARFRWKRRPAPQATVPDPRGVGFRESRRPTPGWRSPFRGAPAAIRSLGRFATVRVGESLGPSR